MRAMDEIHDWHAARLERREPPAIFETLHDNDGLTLDEIERRHDAACAKHGLVAVSWVTIRTWSFPPDLSDRPTVVSAMSPVRPA